MKYLFLLPFICVVLFSCYQQQKRLNAAPNIDLLAKQYVRLGLDIGQYDEAFVDAYYGPDSLKPTAAKKPGFPKDSFLTEIKKLQDAIALTTQQTNNDSVKIRANWMTAQLTAFAGRVKIFSGEYASFDEESKVLFGAVAPSYPESHYKAIVAALDSVLPGKGTVAQRFQALSKKFIIPKDKLDTVFRTAIAECRKRTLAHYTLPANENFVLEYVSNKPWSGYNWYKGNYQSLIQINTDLPILIDRAIDVGSHESYPGHHVYNMLLEKNLYHDKGWVEISLYPLFSPQSLIAEGSANYGIEIVFPGQDKIAFCKEVLLPLAGLDTTGITTYFNTLELRNKLNFARNEVARGLINKTMDSTGTIRWLKEYGLMNEALAKKSMRFIEVNRTYVINYNYGMELVKNYIAAKDNGGTKTWDAFGTLLSSPLLPSDLLKQQ